MAQIYHKYINVTTLCSYNESKTTVTEKWMVCCVKLLRFCCRKVAILAILEVNVRKGHADLKFHLFK